jgi:glycosyltransferase involved in cell wall biosynthesis
MEGQMRIAMISPLVEATPPALYGGTERVVSTLTEELVCRGHDVTLFATADAQTSATLVPCEPRGLRLQGRLAELDSRTAAQLRLVFARAAQFDIIHNHVDFRAFPFAAHSPTPVLSTAHGRLDKPAIQARFLPYLGLPHASISRDQQRYLPELNWIGTVCNAIAVEHFHFRPTPGDYLVFLGRINPEKRPDRAIAIAARAGRRLVIAAKVDPEDEDYYRDEIAPLIRRSPHVEFIGEVDEAQKDALLGGAYATLFPIDWPEPFGLTMVESMATGTPVVAWRNGSVPEVIDDGVTGFIGSSIDELVAAVDRVRLLDRHACRADVETRFAPPVMAAGYERLYRALTETADETPRHAVPAVGVGG